MKKRLLIITLSIIGLIGIMVGVSLAFFGYIKEGSTANTLELGSVVFHYDEITGKGRGINLIDALPTDSNEGEKTNNNYFEFSIKSNTTILEIPYTVAARLSEDTNIDNSIVRIYLTELEGSTEKEILYTKLSELENKVFIRDYAEKVLYRDTVPVDGNDYEKIFRLRMWIDEDVDYSTGEYNNQKLNLTVNVYTNDGKTITAENTTTKEDTGIKMISANNMYEAEKVSDPEPEQEMIEKNVNYDLTVPYEVNTINFDVMTRNMKADVEVEELGTSLSYNEKGTVKRMNNSNTYNLAVRDNYFKVKVTSADKSERTNYLLRVDREYDKDNSLTYLAVDGYSFTEEFDKDTLIYNTVGLETDKVTILGNKSSEVASIEGLGEKSLSWGENRFNVVVTPQDPNTSSKTYTIIVNRVRPTSPTLEATTNEWTATNPVVSVLAQGSAIGGIDHYEVYKTDTINLPTDETEATAITDDTYEIDTDGTYYIYYRTVSGNGYKSLWSNAITVHRDTTGPSVPTSGSIGNVSGTNTTGTIQTVASGSIDSGVGEITYKYLVTNTNTQPSKDDTNFKEALTFTRSCGTSYYAWAIAEDSLGNRSDVLSLGNTSDEANSYSAWGACSEKCGATGTQTRTNTCALVTTELSQSCTVGTTYKDTNGKWGACSKTCGGGTQSYTVTRTWYSNQDNSVCSQQTGVVTTSQACNTGSCCAYSVGKYWDYNYTGGIQSFTVPCSGTYQLQVYGAQGSDEIYDLHGYGGYGGYAVGNVSLSSGATLYVVVGGYTGTTAGGYNGGGASKHSYASGGSGGGATHIGTRYGTLAQYGNTSGLYIVAGGGGGGSEYGSVANNGGSGGGTNGGNGGSSGTAGAGGTGGTQTSGYSFGQGGPSCGGGLYGGNASSGNGGGAGGSGYIGGVSGGSMANGQRAGNGFARITLKSISN